MAAIFKMATKTKFARKNYKSSFFKKMFRAVLVVKIPKFYRKKKFSKIQDGAHIQHRDFFSHLFPGALIFVRNFKMVRFLHILEEQTQKKNKKICCQKLNSK
jgi:hypothetical protein